MSNKSHEQRIFEAQTDAVLLDFIEQNKGLVVPYLDRLEALLGMLGTFDTARARLVDLHGGSVLLSPDGLNPMPAEWHTHVPARTLSCLGISTRVNSRSAKRLHTVFACVRPEAVTVVNRILLLRDPQSPVFEAERVEAAYAAYRSFIAAMCAFERWINGWAAGTGTPPDVPNVPAQTSIQLVRGRPPVVTHYGRVLLSAQGVRTATTHHTGRAVEMQLGYEPLYDNVIACLRALLHYVDPKEEELAWTRGHVQWG